MLSKWEIYVNILETRVTIPGLKFAVCLSWASVAQLIRAQVLLANDLSSNPGGSELYFFLYFKNKLLSYNVLYTCINGEMFQTEAFTNNQPLANFMDNGQQENLIVG